MSFGNPIPLIQPGDPVSAGVANAAPQSLDQKLQYLYNLVQAAAVGATIFARQVPLEPAAAAGMPVFWDDRTARFARALAGMTTDPATGALVMTAASQVWGVVAAKSDATTGDLLLLGYAALDVAAATGGSAPVPAGLYYLSGVTPGGLVLQRPPVSVPVLRADGAGRVLLLSQVADQVDRHTHYGFALACRPAGTVTPPSPGERHVIAASDPTVPGWLPADDPSFAGTAPAGAKFGYNLAAAPDLKNLWPPIPVSQAVLQWDRGVDKEVGGTLVPATLCTLDRHGLWWNSDCYGDVPWPAAYNNAFGDSESLSYSDSVAADRCPRPLEMTLALWFTRVEFATDSTAVTSLRSGDDRLAVTCLGSGAPGTMGDLVLHLNLDWTVTANAPGSTVLKQLEGTDFLAGPVVEGVKSGSPNVHLSSDLPARGGLYQGQVTVAVDPAATLELAPELVRVDEVTTEFYQDTFYLGFLPGQASDLRGRIRVPADTVLESPQLVFRLRLLGTELGGLPALALSARRLARPSAGTTTPLDLPDASSEADVAIATAATLSSGYQYVEAASSPLAVAAGDLVDFTVSRTAGDGYTGIVGVLEIAGVLSAGD